MAFLNPGRGSRRRRLARQYPYDEGSYPAPKRYSAPGLYSVALYNMTREYGGPEEGGWYYDGYQFLPEYSSLVRTFANEDAAREYEGVLEELCIIWNKGLRPYYSVVSQGWTTAMVVKGPPRNMPEYTPRYE